RTGDTGLELGTLGWKWRHIPPTPLSPCPQVSPPPLPPEVAQSGAVRDRTLKALVDLAEALGTAATIPKVLAEAKAVLDKAQETRQQLHKALWDTWTPPVATESSVDKDEDEELLLHGGAEAERAAQRLEKEQERLQGWQRWLRAGQGAAMGLTVLCAAVLALDSVRAALGVTKDAQLLLALGSVAVVCEVAGRGLGTSRRHLATAAAQQRETAQRLRDRARQVVAARAAAEATRATSAAIGAAMGRLERAMDALKRLVAAVAEDGKVTPWGTVAQGFPESARVLEDIVVALEPSRDREDKEVGRKLKVALGVLVAQG
ncbi:uncharacterized protein LOC116438939, partial [Corvus moneduloides]|uniref:uncharacterized protein LOC116438939 n=1 Tax=Corvus moneduloides TaxID=1196302 RepID=UPI001362FA7B